MPAGPVTATSGVLVGRVVAGRYRLLAPLGAGGSAEVYLAEDSVLRRHVAVKMLHPALAADPAFLELFRTEAQLAAGLRHPNLLLVHDAGEDDDRPYLVSEYLEGGSLRDLLDRGVRLTPAQALLLGLQAARGLDHAHRRGLVHRDVKPANILFDAEGRVRVADFGIARVLADSAVTEPLGGHSGTARYASPEQADHRAVDHRTDVYSLALVVAEAVTGVLPERQAGEIRPPAEVGPLAPVLAAAGRVDPDARPDAASFARMLKAAASSLAPPDPLPVVARTPDEVRRAGEASEPTVHAEPTPDASGPAPSRRRAGRGRRRWPRRLLVAVVAVVVLAGSGWIAAVEQPWRPTRTVPDLQGLTVEDAAARLRPLGLRPRVAGSVHHEEVEAGRVVSASPRRQREGRPVALQLSRGPAPRTVPLDAVGRPADEVRRQLDALGLEVSVEPQADEIAPEGQVLATRPGGGTKVERGAAVTLVVSSGPAPVTVPETRGLDRSAAAAKLREERLEPGAVTEAFDDAVPAGRVVRTDPPAGGSAKPGTAVAVVVSKGPDLVSVPDVSGLTPAAAESKLAGSGLAVSATFGPAAGTVFTTQPEAGRKVKRGTAVALYTTR